MTTTTPSPALADLDRLIERGTNIAGWIDKFGAKADAADVLQLVALARRAAQPVAPVQDVLTPLDYRAQGREEALAIILAQDAENPFADHTNSVFGGEDYSTEWDEAALRELLHIGDRKHDAYDRAEAAYWEALGRKDEAARELLFAQQAPFYKPLHDFLAKHEAWDLMADLKRSATPSPQVAEGAELPPLPFNDPERALSENWTMTVQDVQQYARDAIAASRRAGVSLAAILDCYSPDDTVSDYQDKIRALFATPAPASAGQAAPALLESLKGVEVSVDVSTCDDDGGHRIFAELTGETGSDGKTLLAVETSRNFAAQPADGAGQAGQVTKCDVCGSTEYSCNGCAKTIATERAAAPADLIDAARLDYVYQIACVKPFIAPIATKEAWIASLDRARTAAATHQPSAQDGGEA